MTGLQFGADTDLLHLLEQEVRKCNSILKSQFQNLVAGVFKNHNALPVKWKDLETLTGKVIDEYRKRGLIDRTDRHYVYLSRDEVIDASKIAKEYETAGELPYSGGKLRIDGQEASCPPLQGRLINFMWTRESADIFDMISPVWDKPPFDPAVRTAVSRATAKLQEVKYSRVLSKEGSKIIWV